MNRHTLIKVIIVDDEPLARARIKRLLQQQPGFICVAEAQNAQQGLALTKQHQPDLMLIDIEMPVTDGISLACQLQSLEPTPEVIFVTAHAEHALEAYRAGPVDYILKPISADRLFEALARARSRVTAQAKPATPTIDKLSYTIAGVTKQLLITDILYCIAEDKYVRVVTHNAEALIDQSLTQLQTLTPKLIRSHRKILINVDHFSSLTTQSDGRTYIQLQGCDEKLDVSRRALATVKQALALKY